MGVSKTKHTELPAIGTLVARTEAPTVLYRVTSRTATTVRILPFRRSGGDHHLSMISGMIFGDGSTWIFPGSEALRR